MQRQTIAVVGGTGFIGSRLVNTLVGSGARVRIAARRREHARHLAMLPVEIVELGAFDERELARFVAGARVAVNLVGVLHGARGLPYGERFARLHVALPASLAAACIEARVPRVIHVSALGADPHAPSMYLRSKGDGEAALHARAATGALDVTVFRPSVVFGPGDAFLTLFARLQRLLPVLPLAMPDALIQPVYVGDVALALANACVRDATRGKTYELGGPRTYRLEALVRYAGALAGRRARIVRLPDALARMQARVFELLPGEPLLTRDNLASLSVPSVMTGPLAPELGIAPASVESVAPTYIGDTALYSRFAGWRARR
ncbi:complex I NDUFA9 subunit family protein [Burkholderia sp. TSV86]|uniref:complex I NDUFA9 subunit family protein n=1 Tax=Burkholderia sp. TSV86 TaxID=1385594 RepID=UPI0007521265|nr:complex I NDUFA9 subunit family protein [Burkholderia sp. TSV86]KVE33454.1 NAD-dependent dehydratase [Burkholderia sp. TSV86]